MQRQLCLFADNFVTAQARRYTERLRAEIAGTLSLFVPPQSTTAPLLCAPSHEQNMPVTAAVDLMFDHEEDSPGIRDARQAILKEIRRWLQVPVPQLSTVAAATAVRLPAAMRGQLQRPDEAGAWAVMAEA
jgi:hypothetical protein